MALLHVAAGPLDRLPVDRCVGQLVHGDVVGMLNLDQALALTDAALGAWVRSMLTHAAGEPR